KREEKRNVSKKKKKKSKTPAGDSEEQSKRRQSTHSRKQNKRRWRQSVGHVDGLSWKKEEEEKANKEDGRLERRIRKCKSVGNGKCVTAVKQNQRRVIKERRKKVLGGERQQDETQLTINDSVSEESCVTLPGDKRRSFVVSRRHFNHGESWSTYKRLEQLRLRLFFFLFIY
ncbi:calponin domain protein, partial [Reticulomyxa filosa]